MGPVSGETPKLRSALYSVLSNQPGVSLLGPTQTHLGAAGVGFSILNPGPPVRLIVDPTTGELLESQSAPLMFGPRRSRR